MTKSTNDRAAIAARYQAVLFDLDGTLFSSEACISGAAGAALREFGFTDPGEEALRSFVGPPFLDTVRRLYDVDDEELLRRLEARFSEGYVERQHLFTVYEGVPAMLAGLRELGVLTAVATMKDIDQAELELTHYGLRGLLDAVGGAENGVEDKGVIIRAAMERLGVDDPGRALMIGDSPYDQSGAAGAGVDFIAVTYGYGFARQPGREPLPGCLYVADTVADLHAFLCGSLSDATA